MIGHKVSVPKMQYKLYQEYLLENVGVPRIDWEYYNSHTAGYFVYVIKDSEKALMFALKWCGSANNL